MQTKRIAIALFAVALVTGLAFAAGTAPKAAEAGPDCAHGQAKAGDAKACCAEHAAKKDAGDSCCCCCDDACERPAKNQEAPKH
jgi:hypothetical protein